MTHRITFYGRGFTCRCGAALHGRPRRVADQAARMHAWINHGRVVEGWVA